MSTLRSQIATFLALPVIYAGAEAENLPQSRHALPLGALRHSSWDNTSPQTSYILQTPKDEIAFKVDVIHQFASALLNSSIELDRDIVRAIDEEFWNLL